MFSKGLDLIKKILIVPLLTASLVNYSAFANDDDAKDGSIKMMFDDESEDLVKKEFSDDAKLQEEVPVADLVKQVKGAAVARVGKKIISKKLRKKASKKSAKKSKKTSKKSAKKRSKTATTKHMKVVPQLSEEEAKSVSKIIARISNDSQAKQSESNRATDSNPQPEVVLEEKRVPEEVVELTKDFVEKPLEIVEAEVQRAEEKFENKPKKDQEFVKFSNLMITSVNFNNNYQASNSSNQYEAATGNVKLLSDLAFGKHYFIRSYLNYTQSKKAPGVVVDNGNSFQNMGLRAEELTVGYQSEQFTALAGKFLLNFGNAWRWNKSIWLTNIASNYRESEKLGATAFIKFGNSKIGRYHLGFASFTNDRKNFDNSMFSNRYSATKSDAKAGDTRSLKSYMVSLDTRFDFSAKEKLTYHFAYSDMAVNALASSVDPTKIDSQKSWVAGMEYQYPLNDDFTLNPLLEYAAKKNINGNSDVHEDYSTAAISAKFHQHWYATTGLSRIRHFNLSDYGFDQNIFELSVGYEFSETPFFDKMVIQAGYQNQRTNNQTSLETSNAVGGLVRMAKNF